MINYMFFQDQSQAFSFEKCNFCFDLFIEKTPANFIMILTNHNYGGLNYD